MYFVWMSSVGSWFYALFIQSAEVSLVHKAIITITRVTFSNCCPLIKHKGINYLMFGEQHFLNDRFISKYF